MEGVEKETLFVGIRSVPYAVSLAESISQVILYFSRYNLGGLRWYMHNDVHKARNKWRVLRKNRFCREYASAFRS
jgi:hypothetical protein